MMMWVCGSARSGKTRYVAERYGREGTVIYYGGMSYATLTRTFEEVMITGKPLHVMDCRGWVYAVLEMRAGEGLGRLPYALVVEDVRTPEEVYAGKPRVVEWIRRHFEVVNMDEERLSMQFMLM